MRYIDPIKYALLALLATVAFGLRAGAEDAGPQPEANSSNAGVRVDACASDPSRLGLSRIVEIDTTGGPQFGGGHSAATDFLKDGEVVLTFDDGPMRHNTRPVLKALADECTKATFFMVGRMAASDPAMVREVAAAGHTVASHTWSHQNLRPLGLLRARQEFEMGLTAINKALGKPQAAPFFRFPYLSENRFIVSHAKSRNISTIWVDVDSKDYMTRDPKIVHNRIMAQLRTQRKGIILMHDIQPSTAAAIKGLLRDLHDKGFKVVHIVPRTTVDAVAMYDGAVTKTFDEKSKAVAANPLANRSMVWTMAPAAAGVANGTLPAAAKSAAKTAAIPAAVTPPAPPQVGATDAASTPSADEELPWLKPAVKPPVDVKPVVKPKKPAATARDESSWQSKIFGY